MNIDLDLVEKKIKYVANNKDWLKQALCHKSFNKENKEWPHNEKLEFLGDAVLDVILSDILMEQFQEDKEGSLSRKRASIVNEVRLSELAKQCELDNFILIGQREANNKLRENSRILASAFEAIVGAIYKDSGFDVVFKWVETIFTPVLSEAFSEHDFESDYKTRFQERVQEEFKTTPVYKVIDQFGPDHDRVFEVEVFVDNKSFGSAKGVSKKNAAQLAAKSALRKLEK